MSTKKESAPSFYLSIRFFMCMTLFLGYCLNYMQKIDMSISIVCMVNNTALSQHSTSSSSSSSSVANYSTHSGGSSISSNYSDSSVSCASSTYKKKASHDGPFAWSKGIQGIVLSAYFYGYILMQLPGGILSFKFGGRIILALSMSIGSTFTLLIPVCAKWDYKALVACLFFTGLSHGAFWPSCSTFWSYWAPTNERSRLIGMASSGAKVGNILALAIGGVLCISAGWETLFYLIGGSGVVWSLVFFLVSSDSPKDHRFIGSREKDFIMEATRKTINAKRICQSHVPWKKIFASKACWSIFIGHFAHNWGNYLFLTQTPSFLRDVLKFDIKSNGLVSTIPYIAAWIAINASSYASDLLSNKISRTLNRRIFSALGLYLPAAFIIGLSFVTCENVALGVALLTLGVATDSSMTGAGYLVNMNDIAGPYSGIIFGISNTFGTLPGLLAPLITGLITKDRTQKQWQLVFIICALVYVILGTIDLILLDANMQPWAIIEDKDEETKKIEIKDTEVTIKSKKHVHKV